MREADHGTDENGGPFQLLLGEENVIWFDAGYEYQSIEQSMGIEAREEF